MTVKYYDLGGHKKLNEIVFAGSHDAGITSGGGNVQTQDLDIYLQAASGVRFFDTRVAAQLQATAGPNGKEVTFRAIHANEKLMFNKTKSRYVTDLQGQRTVEQTDLPLGGKYGLGLTKILDDAAQFVKDEPSEFLILKFDKSTNWPLIGRTCLDVLGDRIYDRAGNLNTATLDDLAGKVVVLFTPDGLATIPVQQRSAGIHGVKNLYTGGAYDRTYDGLQYYGKGGTNPFKPFRKIKQNVKKQRKLLAGGAGLGNSDVMGMMYWTTTGLMESIEGRNDTMWTDNKVGSLQSLWNGGLGDIIVERMPQHVSATKSSSAPILKMFMPNIVMIDFADALKCETIFDLNFVAGLRLVDAALAMDDL